MKARSEQEILEGMLDEADNAVNGNVPKQGELPELHSEPAFEIDYDKIQKKSNKQARTLLKNATGFMIGDDLAKNNPYIQSKIKTDVLSLGGMLYQVELMLVMQKTLAEEIRHGARGARFFEVFGTLGKTIAENNKQLLQTVEAIKVTYLDLKENILHMNGPMIEQGLQKTEEGTISLGSRDLIEQANERKKKRMEAALNSSIEDAEEVN